MLMFWTHGEVGKERKGRGEERWRCKIQLTDARAPLNGKESDYLVT